MFSALDPYIGAIKAIVIAAVLVGLFGFGYKVGGGRVQAKWDDAKVQQLAAEHDAVLIRLADNQRIAERQQKEKQELKKGYEHELNGIRDFDRNAAGGLRLPASACDGLARPAEAGGTSGSPEAFAGTVALPKAIENDLWELMRQADELVASCRVAQKFITDNGMAP